MCIVCGPSAGHCDDHRAKQGPAVLTCRRPYAPLPNVTRRSDRLLREIESGALDHRTSIGDVLRKAIALGGRAGSTELR